MIWETICLLKLIIRKHKLVGISYGQLKEYLSVLIENNLIEYSNGTQTFKTTEKGLNCLKMYREIGEFLQQKTTGIKNN